MPHRKVPDCFGLCPWWCGLCPRFDWARGRTKGVAQTYKAHCTGARHRLKTGRKAVVEMFYPAQPQLGCVLLP